MPGLAAWINPLQFTEIDVHDDRQPPGVDRVLEYLFAPGTDRTVDAFVKRYREISKPPGELPVAPNEPTILKKLVWPLRQAKGSYALGNFITSIALCGMVGEMVAILLWDISKFSLQGHPMTEAEQTAIFGSTFERLGQDRRSKVLRSLQLIDEESKTAFDVLRTIRARYLHLLSQPHENIAVDARRAYEASLKLVTVVLGQSFEGGGVVLRHDLVAYLTEKGIVAPG